MNLNCHYPNRSSYAEITSNRREGFSDHSSNDSTSRDYPSGAQLNSLERETSLPYADDDEEKVSTFLTEKRLEYQNHSDLEGNICVINGKCGYCRNEHCGIIRRMFIQDGVLLGDVELFHPCCSRDSNWKGERSNHLIVLRDNITVFKFYPYSNDCCRNGDICQVFFSGKFHIVLFQEDNNTFKSLKKDGQSKYKKRDDLHPDSYRSIFRSSRVAETTDNCYVFVPGDGRHSGKIKKRGNEMHTVEVQGKINLSNVGIDSKYFYHENSVLYSNCYRVNHMFIKAKWDSPKHASVSNSSKCANVAEVNHTAKYNTLPLLQRNTGSPLPVRNTQNNSLCSSSDQNCIKNQFEIIQTQEGVKEGDLCEVSDEFMKELCEKPNHYGTVFKVFAGKGGRTIVGVELNQECNCKTIGDGTYKDVLLLHERRPKKCLFIPESKVRKIHDQGKEKEQCELAVNDICRVSIPGVQNGKDFFGKISNIIPINSKDPDVEVEMMENSLRHYQFPRWPESLKVFDNGRSIFVTLPSRYIQFIFRSSTVEPGNICNFHMPSQGSFKCLVEDISDVDQIRVSLLESNIDMSNVPIDEQFFKKLVDDVDVYLVSPSLLQFVSSTIDESTSRAIIDNEDGGDDGSLSPEMKSPKRNEHYRKPRTVLDTKIHLGRYKGIQGHHNSCYMDSLLYCLFTFSDTLDEICDVKSSDTVANYTIKNDFKTMILNPLRSDDCFVTASNVMQIRKQLEPFLPGVSTEEKDAEELLTVLFSKDFAGVDGFKPLLHIRNQLLNEDQDLFVYQIFVEIGDEKEHAKIKRTMPSVENLLAQSFILQGQFLREDPKYLLVQLPRFGREKLFPAIYLPPKLNLREISPIKQFCSICNNVADLRCRSCSLAHKENDLLGSEEMEAIPIVKFCEDCFRLTHKTRLNHETEKFTEFMPEALNGCVYDLESVISIQTSHYVSFVRVKKSDGKHTWLFFDSMADRIELTKGLHASAENVPVVQLCDSIERQLGDLGKMDERSRYDYVMQHSRQDEHFKRLTQDAYIAVYKQHQECKETSL